VRTAWSACDTNARPRSRDGEVNATGTRIRTYLSEDERKSKLRRIAKMKRFVPSDYEQILGPYLDTHENLRYCDYVHEEIGDRRILLIRHDIDHDHLTAHKIAQWEADRGLRATYCVLHTAWYYGELDGHRHVHTQDLVDLVVALHELGHEINFHNNVVVTALKVGTDPKALMRAELGALRSYGVPVTGTASHGDALCRELNFRNWEIFSECCDERFGGPRTLCYDGPNGKRSIELGAISMHEFGLDYEGYDVLRDLYHTDSGGRQRTVRRAPGRRRFGRQDYDRGEVIAVLTHPEWWDFGAI
jgi:hypothetical protein